MSKEERIKRILRMVLFGLMIAGFTLLSILVGGPLYEALKSGVLARINHKPLSVAITMIIIVATSYIVGEVVFLCLKKIPLRMMHMLIDKMNSLAAGDFKVRVKLSDPLKWYFGVEELENSFNVMAEQLENTEMFRKDFINNFSHEFKTPIVSIAGFAKLLKRGNLTEKQRAEYLDIIEEESLRLSTMATNVLNLTKVENQTILTDISYFNLSEQLRNCVLLLEAKWSKKNIDFEIEFDEYMFSANEELLKQVWINLIDNAIKFSPERETIELLIKDEEDAITVSVANKGSEITPEQQKRIFNKFYQADESHSSEGNGVGLALVKSIVELHEGVVSVSSENNITVFTVELPKSFVSV